MTLEQALERSTRNKARQSYVTVTNMGTWVIQTDGGNRQISAVIAGAKEYARILLASNGDRYDPNGWDPD